MNETPRQQGDAFSTAVLKNHTRVANDDEKPSFNFNDGFDGGFMWMASTKERSCVPKICEITVLVDSGATEHLLGRELVPKPGEFINNYALVDVSKT